MDSSRCARNAAHVVEYRCFRRVLQKFVSPVLRSMRCSSVLGHVSTDALAGASLSDIYTTSTAFLISGGVLTTFCGQGNGYRCHN